VTPARAPVPGILEIGSTKQAFLDDGLIFETSRVISFMTRPQKYSGNPILVADRPWEGDGIQTQGQGAIYDEQERLFKLWYLPRAGDPHQVLTCYAVSEDGLHWEKPNLGLIEYRGSKKNNIVYVGDYFAPNNIVKDLHDPDPQRRYKGLGEWDPPPSNQSGGASAVFSPDGLRWTPYRGNPVIHHGRNMADSPDGLLWDPRLRKFVLFPRPGQPLAQEIYGNGDHRHIRSVGYSSSDDFLHWTPTVPILAPDHDVRNDYQYMDLTASIDGEFYVGLLAMHETHEQTWDIFLMSSRDGMHWNWIERQTPFLGRGEAGSYDGGYMTPCGPVFKGDKTYIIYGAYSGEHSENERRLGKNIMSMAVATLPRNRWLGLMAGPHRATIVTRPLLFKGSRLMVDLDAGLAMEKPRNPPRYDECEVRAALEDQSGGRIEGFTIDRSRVLRSSGEQEMIWEGADVGKLAGKPVRIRFEFHSAAIYSIQFA